MVDERLELKRSGNRLLAQRQFDDAQKKFEELIRKFPHAPEGYVGLAKVFSRTNRPEEVVSLLEPVAEDIDYAPTFHLLGDACRILANRGKREFVDRAIEYYRRYHERRPDPVSLFYQADLLAKKKKDHEAALSCYRASWDLDPKGRLAYNGILNCLRRLGREEEIAEYKTLWKERKKTT